jgi:hypothetical protein
MSRKRKAGGSVSADAVTETAERVSIMPRGADNVEGVVTLPFDIDDDSVSELAKVRAGVKVNPTYEPLLARPETPELPKSKPQTGKRPDPVEYADLHERVLREEARKYCWSPEQIARREEEDRILEQWRQREMQRKDSWEEPKSRQSHGPDFPHNLPFTLEQLAEVARANPLVEEKEIKKGYRDRLHKIEAKTIEREVIAPDGVKIIAQVEVIPMRPRQRRKSGRGISIAKEKINRHHLLSAKERQLFLDYVADNLAFNVVAERKPELEDIAQHLARHKAKLSGETRFFQKDGSVDLDDSHEIQLIRKTGGSSVGGRIHRLTGQSFNRTLVKETGRRRGDRRVDNGGPDRDDFGEDSVS